MNNIYPISNSVEPKAMLRVINPYSGEPLAEVPKSGVVTVPAAVERAVCGRSIAASLTSGQRAKILKNAAVLIRERREIFARRITNEAGKIIRPSRKEVMRCINTLELSASEAIRFNGESIPFDSMEAGQGKIGFYEHRPLGSSLPLPLLTTR